MAVYTISQGEKVTASILNTYAMNAGLVYVTSQTIGSASSSLASGVIFTIPALFLWHMPPSFLQIGRAHV